MYAEGAHEANEIKKRSLMVKNGKLKRRIGVKNWTMVILVAVTFLNLSQIEGLAAARTETSLSLSTGYRVDNLDFNIAGGISGCCPNVLSELTWNDLRIYRVKTGGKVIVNKIIYLQGSLGYGWIVDGENQDSDFLGNNRTIEFSRSNNSADDGNVLDVSFGVGYPFTFGSDKLGITPLVGYSHHEQKLRITDGFQTIPLLGPFPELDSTYETQWNGPWVGLGLLFKATKQLTFLGDIEYHWADYEAEADWNLRDDFAHPISFKHIADGTGTVISVGGSFAITNRLSMNIDLAFHRWSTDPGIDKTFFADGSTATTRLNEVNWDSGEIMLGVMFYF